MLRAYDKIDWPARLPINQKMKNCIWVIREENNNVLKVIDIHSRKNNWFMKLY